MRSNFSALVFSALICCVAGVSCDSQKETVASRGMQNLTARYNILYNAGELLKESERNILDATADDYDRLIAVFKEPTELTAQPELKSLDEAILKANKVANEKSLSKFVDDAYFLIGRANHLKANFYNAVEYFTYVYANYPQEKELRQASLAWKARSLMASERFSEAEATLDSAFKHLNTEKRSVGDIYALRAQLHLYASEDKEALNMLQEAVKHTKDTHKRIRWHYLMAQLHHMQGNTSMAYDYYTAVVKSNAPFDMAFNADLNRISIRNEVSGNTQTRTELLRGLLKDDKNRDFVDQIYFEIGKSYLAEQDIENAIRSFNTSVRKSTSNPTQKGLSYLELANIYLDQQDFLRAKNYYDSTLTSLPQTFPDYELIENKAQNLDILADRLAIIAREDTLQMLANLPVEDREVRIGALVREQALKAINQADSTASSLAGSSQALAPSSRSGRFYFSNAAALTQGMADFRRRWGNRKLEDNWRRSQKSPTDMQSTMLPDQTAGNAVIQQSPADAAAANTEAIRKTFIEALPLTIEQKAASDLRIANAYFDIANYYRDVTLDTAAAVSSYEALLNRFPENENKLAAYYNLYRLYNLKNQAKSDQFKNRLLSDYPESPFAKIILDPLYSQKSDEQEQAFNRFYTDGYHLYADKRYQEVLALSARYGQLFTGRPLPAQLDYLRALAIGRTQALPALETAFKELVAAFPEDILVTPLVKIHLDYINNNRDLLSRREFAIVDHDPNEAPFIEEPANIQPQQPVADTQPAPVQTQPVVTPHTAPVIQTVPAQTAEAETLPGKPPVLAATSIFTAEDEAVHYYVVNVIDGGTNLSPSRFGIGQFNRVNMPGAGIRHQLKSIKNENQLIFVGPFANREAVQSYFNSINPLMKDIMKIPAERYNTFFINQQNLDRLNDRATVDMYIEFFKATYR